MPPPILIAHEACQKPSMTIQTIVTTSKSDRENDGESNGSDLAEFRILFEFRFNRFGQNLGVI